MRGGEPQAATKHGAPQAFKPDVLKYGRVIHSCYASDDPCGNHASLGEFGLQAGLCQGV